MAPRLSRLERVTNLVLALLETPRPLSLREIGSVVAGYPSEHGALRQAFERDKRTLRDGGIPIAVERVDGEDQVGYRILPEEYYLPDLGLDPDENEALGFALAAVRLEGVSGTDIAEKLGAAPSDVPPLAVLPSLDALGPLHDAIRTKSVAHFTYHGRRRSVEGRALVFERGAWYLRGPDRAAEPPGDERTFRVDRIDGPVELDEAGTYEPAARPTDRTPRALAEIDEPELVAVLAVDRQHVSALGGMLGRDAMVERDADLGAVVRIPVRDVDAFCSFVLGFGDGVEVLEPTEVREAVIARLEAAVGR